MQRRPDEPYPREDLSGQPPVEPTVGPPTEPDYIARPITPSYTTEPGRGPEPRQPTGTVPPAPGRLSPDYYQSADAAAAEQMQAYTHDRGAAHPMRQEHAGLDTSSWTKLSDVINRPIIDLTNGSKLGQLDDLVLDDDHSRIMGFVTQGKILHGPTVYPAQGATIGQDAVTLPAGARQRFDEQRLRGMPLARPLIGMRLLSTKGNIVGQIKDVRFDPHSWAVAYEVEGTGNVLQRLFHPGAAIPASAIQSYGQDAIIVGDAAAEQYLGGSV